MTVEEATRGSGLSKQRETAAITSLTMVMMMKATDQPSSRVVPFICFHADDLTHKGDGREGKEGTQKYRQDSWGNVSASGITEWPRRIEME